MSRSFHRPRAGGTTGISDSYPPSTMTNTSAPLPHPYQLANAGYHSPIETESTAVSPHQQPQLELEKPLVNPPNNYEPRPRRQSRGPSIASRSLPIHLRPFVMLLIFLPIPPLLSLLYTLVGHAILRSTKTAHSIYHLVSLLSSVEAGATGGIIISLPLALLLYLLLFPDKEPTAPEDFFEDDDSSISGTPRWRRYTGYVTCVLFVLCVGGVAAPLGVTCLSSANGGDAWTYPPNNGKILLTPPAAAAAGVLGGVLLAFGSLAMAVIAIVAWSFWIRHRREARASAATLEPSTLSTTK